MTAPKRRLSSPSRRSTPSSTSLAEAQRDAQVRSVLVRLPDAQRMPLVLFHFEDRSYQQIAQDLGISVAKVKTDILRGRLALAKLLQGSDVEPAPAAAR